jgi:hypothetical protein
VALPCLLVAACAQRSLTHGTKVGADAGGKAHTKTRTVSVEVLPVVEQAMSTGADGGTVLADPVPIAGVEVCPWKARPRLGTLADFVDLDWPSCPLTDDMGAVPPFDGLPANSELVFRYRKNGFVPAVTTEVTSSVGVTVPNFWRGNGTSSVMFREGALDAWLEAETPAAPGNGMLAIVTTMSRDGTGGSLLPVAPVAGVVTQAEFFSMARGVRVTVQSSGGDVPALDSHADRPSYLSLPAAEYTLTFAHRRAHCIPRTEYWDIYPFGYPAGEDSLRIPIFAGYLSTASVHCDCFYNPVDGGPAPLDVAACSLPDSGAP